MSEGPEVHRIAQRQDEQLAGADLIEVETNLRKARGWMERHPGALTGRRIERVTACGKHILWYMDDGLWFHFHLLMFGKWEYHPADAVVPYDRTTRAQIRTSNALLALCNGQVFDIGIGDPYAELPTLAALGPDMCAVPFDRDEFIRRLLRPQHHAQGIGVVLLDQTVANGVGNYLKAEIMFECRLDPWRTVGALTSAEIDCIADAVPLVAQRALANRGWTVPDDLRELIEAGVVPGGRGKRHWVFRRTNQPCHRCGGKIRQKRQGPGEGRWTFWCETCQPAGAERPSSASAA
ncbi:MAG: Fpg/Nei family DNA glycosylase [Chloroflexia bacterium]